MKSSPVRLTAPLALACGGLVFLTTLVASAGAQTNANPAPAVAPTMGSAQPAAVAPVETAAAVAAPGAKVGSGVLAPKLTLDQAIALALKNNQRIKVSYFGKGIGRAGVLTAAGAFDPTITFNRNYSENDQAVSSETGLVQITKTDNYSLTFNGLMPWGLNYQIGASAQNQRGTYNLFANNYLTFGGITVTQPLLRGFGFGANLADLRIAKADRAIADWQFRQTVIDTVTNVIDAYEGLAEAREYLDIAQRSRDAAAQLVSDNERRNRVGAISDADVIQARARLANREEFILIAYRGVKDAENQLRELIGETFFPVNGPDIAIDPLTPAPNVTADGASDLRRALDLRPDYQAAKQGVLKFRATDAQARNQLLPQLDFVGSYGYTGLDPSFAASRAQVRNEDHRAYSVGMVVSVPLTFAQGRGRARAARLALRQSEADVVRLEQDIAVSVAAAIGQLETTAQRVAATTQAYELAQQTVDAEQKRLKAGTSSTFIVLQLQEQAAAVQQSQVRAIADQHRAIAEYQRVIGTTLIAHRLTVQ